MIHAQRTKLVSITPPAAIKDNGAYTTAELDTLGFDYATIIVYLGATDVPMTALKVQESDVSGSGMADVTGLIYGTSNGIGGSASVLPSAGDDNKFFVFDIDLRGRKRYLDLGMTAGDGTAGTFAAAFAILSRADETPETAAQRGAADVLRGP